MRVDYSARSGGIIGFFVCIFFSMKTRCVFSLESPHQHGYTHRAIISNIKNVCSYGIFS